jgi:hypothetical protein
LILAREYLKIASWIRTGEDDVMAKKKTTQPPAAEDQSPEPPKQKNIFALKGTEAWKAWLDAFARSKGMPVTVLVDHALRELAKRDGYQDPPARVI